MHVLCRLVDSNHCLDPIVTAMTGQLDSDSDSQEVSILCPTDHKSDVKRVRNQYVCSYGDCNAVFNRLFRLNRHLRQHSGERPFMCPISGCDRAFSCKSYLSKHIKRPHHMTSNGDKRVDESHNESKVIETKKCRKQYVCNDCSKKFKTKFELKMHGFQHSGVKPFECHECDKRFVTKSKLKSHLKTHDGYPCGRDGCDYIAFKWSELRKHAALSHIVCLKCDSCGQTFKNSFNLSSHQKSVHTNESNKIVCHYDGCGKTYSNESNLKTHIRTQHKKQLFECTHEGCDKTFFHKKSLNKHLETHNMPPKIKIVNKLYRKRSSYASKLTSIELNESQMKKIIDFDVQFRSDNLPQI